MLGLRFPMACLEELYFSVSEREKKRANLSRRR